MTGTLNRNAYERRLNTLRKETADLRDITVIAVDINDLKKLNDTYGHQAGDAVLRQVAHLLKTNSRTTDYVCRYGGEEMSIILPNTGEEEAFSTAQKICDRVAQNKFKLAKMLDKKKNMVYNSIIKNKLYKGGCI